MVREWLIIVGFLLFVLVVLTIDYEMNKRGKKND